jgi:hypothetical protein
VKLAPAARKRRRTTGDWRDVGAWETSTFEVDAHDVVAIMGGRDVQVPDAPPGAPRIRIHGIVVMGGLEVRAV